MKQIITWHISCGATTLGYCVRMLVATLLAAIALPAQALTVKAINTGLMPVRAVVTFEDGDIKVGFVRTSFAVFVR